MNYRIATYAVLLGLGLGLGYTGAQLVPRAYAQGGADRVEPGPAPGVATWAYLCFSGSTSSEVMDKANRAGAQGWELVSAAPGHGGSVWCFRQPRWARPLPAAR